MSTRLSKSTGSIGTRLWLCAKYGVCLSASSSFLDRHHSQTNRVTLRKSGVIRHESDAQAPKEELVMKKLSVVVAGTGQIRDIEIEPGTTSRDILNQLGIPDYLLSKGPNEPFFAAAESVYDKVADGEKIFASTKAEVGRASGGK